jgi:reductive dehalogenase
MKGLGLTGIGLGAATATAPVFHDLDEMMSSHGAVFDRPWWVKDREIGNPTCEIDWHLMHRKHGAHQAQSAYELAYYYGEDQVLGRYQVGRDKTIEFIQANKKHYRLQDYTLADASSSRYGGSKTFMPPGRIKTPDYYDVPKWSGTPEENARLVRRASIFLGASLVGFGELGEHEREHLVFTHNKGGGTSTAFINNWPPPLRTSPAIVFEDVDVGYTDGEKCVLPENVPLWDISVQIPMAKEAFRTTPCGSFKGANSSRYRLMSVVQPCIQDFIGGLGYNCYGYPDGSGGLIPANASAILTGIAEPCRHSDNSISPEYGPVAGYYSLITDMPLEPNPPIDAGIFRFCHTCYKCAELCPSDSITMDKEPTWEIPNVEGKPQIHSSPGKKLFWCNAPQCMFYFASWSKPYACGVCHGACTFNVNEGAMVHEVVRSFVSNTSLFNGFFYRMSSTFGYGLKDPDDWWDLSLPAYGYDTTIGAKDNAY